MLSSKFAQRCGHFINVVSFSSPFYYSDNQRGPFTFYYLEHTKNIHVEYFFCVCGESNILSHLVVCLLYAEWCCENCHKICNKSPKRPTRSIRKLDNIFFLSFWSVKTRSNKIRFNSPHIYRFFFFFSFAGETFLCDKTIFFVDVFLSILKLRLRYFSFWIFLIARSKNLFPDE